MATLLPSHFDRSLDEFERAWQERPADGPLPRWQDFLLPDGQALSPKFLFWLLATDIEHRLAAGAPALLAESYLEEQRLPQGGVDPEVVAELVRWEYRLRWQRGDRARRRDYLQCFPHLEANLQDLVPAGSCPRCGLRDLPLHDEDAEAVTCVRCGARLAVAEVFPTRAADAESVADAPTWPPEAPAGMPAAASLPDTTPTAGNTTAAAMPAGPPVRLGRFHIREEIARGGMGVILRGHDDDLNRDVAVKILLDEHADKPELLHRFVEEAQIAGQLQHPGVVPIYELGRLPDRRPFFAMKLVKGRTLADLLAERSDPTQDLPRFLGIFEQVCQAVAFAHSKRVIHRDLKPANVMVGGFGEVQVMDWGLAKVLGAGWAAAVARPAPAAGLSAIRTVRSQPAAKGDATAPDGAQTEAGSVLGTPAYMPPEQARGEVDSLDQRCDVFGLGAILCEILTGNPPYMASESWRVVYLAALGDLADGFARLERCGADKELLALARDCLSPEIDKRPRDAGEVAQRMATYLQGIQERLWSAERERANDSKHHFDRGNALKAKGRWDEAIGCYRKAIDLNPQYAQPYTKLGLILAWKGELDEAIRCHRKAIQLEPGYPLAHYYLGLALRSECRLAESLAALRRAHELGSGRPDWREPSGQLVANVEALVAVEAKLPAYLEGKYHSTDSQECLRLAELCVLKHWHKAAAGFHAAAFVIDPKLAADLKLGHRYKAACYAALAGCGKSNDLDTLNTEDGTRLRRQALDWLRADLDAWGKRLTEALTLADLPAEELEACWPKSGRRAAKVLRTMGHWQQNSDFAGVRGDKALAALPAEERGAWRKLWTDVAALAQKAALIGQVEVKEAALKESEVRLAQAKRRLQKLPRSAEAAEAPHLQKVQQQAAELEKKLEALGKELEALRRELQGSAPARP
jgi:serine/threonine protein kinase